MIFAPDSFEILKKKYNSTILAFLNVLPCTLYQRHILNNIHWIYILQSHKNVTFGVRM